MNNEIFNNLNPIKMNVFNKFNELSGAKFVGINGYLNKKGELSNQTINCNISVENAKISDLATLENFDVSNFDNIELAKTALSELVESAKKNLAKDVADRSVSSQAQTNAYIPLGKGLKINKETGALHITGFAHSKTILVEGEYPTTNKREKTVIKDAIKKEADLKMNKYRSFIFQNADELIVTGDTIQIS